MEREKRDELAKKLVKVINQELKAAKSITMAEGFEVLGLAFGCLAIMVNEFAEDKEED